MHHVPQYMLRFLNEASCLAHLPRLSTTTDTFDHVLEPTAPSHLMDTNSFTYISIQHRRRKVYREDGRCSGRTNAGLHGDS